MPRNANVLIAILYCATASTALACFPDPDAKPTSELSELRLPDRSPDPVVIYTVGNYEIRVKPQDLLKAMRAPGSSRWPDNTFGHRLESLLPLAADIDVSEILVALAPERPIPGEKNRRTADYRRFYRQANQRLGFDFSELLESGLAMVIEKSSGAALNRVVRNEYSETCHGGRKFMAANGAIILATVDWIS